MKDLVNDILNYLKREKVRAERADSMLHCPESGARLHEIDNVYAVIEHRVAQAEKKPVFQVEFMHENALLPVKAHVTDAGWDIHSVNKIFLSPGQQLTVPTGIGIALEPGWEIQVRSRSGLATKGVHVLNSPGTIDAGYRGEIKVILKNSGDLLLEIPAQSRIAQLVFQKVEDVSLTVVKKLDINSTRGDAGFGSTDKKDK